MKRRYLNDTKFHNLVSWIEKSIFDEIFILQDFHDALEFVAAQQEHVIDACPVGGEHEWPTKTGEIYTGACQKCGKHR